jgi:hypothetical protein
MVDRQRADLEIMSECRGGKNQQRCGHGGKSHRKLLSCDAFQQQNASQANREFAIRVQTFAQS